MIVCNHNVDGNITFKPKKDLPRHRQAIRQLLVILMEATLLNSQSSSWCYFLVSFFFSRLTIIHHYTVTLSLDGLQIDFLCIQLSTQLVSITSRNPIVLNADQ